MKKIPLLMVRGLLVIGLIGVATCAVSQDVEAGTRPPGPEFYPTNLTVSPTQASIGQIVTIKVNVLNMLDPGTADVTLEINGVVEQTKEVTLATRESTELTFTVSKDVPGTYSLQIISSTPEYNSISGSFTVGEVTTGVVTTKPEPLNWTLIGGIIAAVVVVTLLVVFLVRRKVA